jgi:hypothetical protein
MSKISLAPDASGTGIFTIASPNSNTNRTLTLPDDTGTIVTNSGNQAGSFTTLNTSGAVVFNDAGADVDFRVEGDTDANLLFVDASTDRVGIGTSSPTTKLHVSGGQFFASGENRGISLGEPNCSILGSSATTNSANIDFYVANAPRVRMDTSGNLLVGTTSQINAGRLCIDFAQSTHQAIAMRNNSAANSGNYVIFMNSADAQAGLISQSGATTVNYGTSSDYRLKENVVPMTGALEKVLELNPVTYTWKVDGSAGEGFIAHELQAVCPDAVVGEKDATEIRQVQVSSAVPATYDEEGNELTPAVEAVHEEREVPVIQSVDTSFLVATLTAAIQELSAKNDALEARIAALETGV